MSETAAAYEAIYTPTTADLQADLRAQGLGGVEASDRQPVQVPIIRKPLFTPAEVAAVERAAQTAVGLVAEYPRVRSVDRIVDAMEAAEKAAQDILHPICIHIAPKSWVAVKSLRDLEQILGVAISDGHQSEKVYRGVTFICSE